MDRDVTRLGHGGEADLLELGRDVGHPLARRLRLIAHGGSDHQGCRPGLAGCPDLPGMQCPWPVNRRAVVPDKVAPVALSRQSASGIAIWKRLASKYRATISISKNKVDSGALALRGRNGTDGTYIQSVGLTAAEGIAARQFHALASPNSFHINRQCHSYLTPTRAQRALRNLTQRLGNL